MVRRVYTADEVNNILRLNGLGTAVPEFSNMYYFVLETIPLSKLSNDIQCALDAYGEEPLHTGLNKHWDNVYYLRNLLLRGVRLPPIIVTPIHSNGEYGIVDGFHRVTAAKLAGKLTIKAFISYFQDADERACVGDIEYNVRYRKR